MEILGVVLIKEIDKVHFKRPTAGKMKYVHRLETSFGQVTA